VKQGVNWISFGQRPKPTDYITFFLLQQLFYYWTAKALRTQRTI